MRIITMLALLIAFFTSCGKQCCEKCTVVDEQYVHKYGLPVKQQDWAKRGEHGKVITTRKNGAVVTKTYKAGILDGETTYTFPHSETIKRIETYEQGKLVGERIQNFSGTPLSETRIDSSGLKIHTTWYENGSPKMIEKHQGDFILEGDYFTLNNQVDSRVIQGEGIRNIRDEYGQLVSTDEIHNGQLVVSSNFHPNGSPKEVVSYKNGKINGLKKTFLPGGEPAYTEEWVNGALQGTKTVFQNGEVYAVIPYHNGYKHGVERRYRDGNIVVEEISWMDDKKQGPSTSYYGNKTKTEWYHQDKQMSKINYDHINRLKPKQQ